MISQKYKNLGPMTFHEAGVGILFVACVLLWIFRKPGFVTGWAEVISTELVSLRLIRVIYGKIAF